MNEDYLPLPEWNESHPQLQSFFCQSLQLHSIHDAINHQSTSTEFTSFDFSLYWPETIEYSCCDSAIFWLSVSWSCLCVRRASYKRLNKNKLQNALLVILNLFWWCHFHFNHIKFIVYILFPNPRMRIIPNQFIITRFFNDNRFRMHFIWRIWFHWRQVG